MKHFVLMQYELVEQEECDCTANGCEEGDHTEEAIMDTVSIGKITHSEDEMIKYLKSIGAKKKDCISYVSTAGDRPGDWEDVWVNKKYAFEIKVKGK